MTTLTIRHEADSDPVRFSVLRGSDQKASDAVEVASPRGFAVEGRPHSDLLHELRWYLERFLEYPFPPETERSDRVQASLQAWGRQAFDGLFGAHRGRDFYRDACKSGLESVTLRISSDDPRVLAWPWESLEDPEIGTLAQLCRIERRLNAVSDPLDLPEDLPTDRVNILLVTARPYENDVSYRSISRRLVELIARKNLPARVRLLRPPTFERLEEVLRERPGLLSHCALRRPWIVSQRIRAEPEHQPSSTARPARTVDL